MSVFQIALVDKVPSGKAEYFDYSAKNIITYTLWEHLVRIAMATKGGFIPGPSWSLGAGHLQAHDVVVYFVLGPSASVASGATASSAAANAGGRTVAGSGGVICEVYVEGNMPARRLGNIAFHEIMHNKLDVGTRAIGNLHTQGGGGLATPPTNEWTPLTARNIQLMSANLFRSVRQHTAAM